MKNIPKKRERIVNIRRGYSFCRDGLLRAIESANNLKLLNGIGVCAREFGHDEWRRR